MINNHLDNNFDVEPDPNNEPADELLKLIMEGKEKKCFKKPDVKARIRKRAARKEHR